ncbi:MAG: HAD family phosphatase [Bdellovibrio sp.]|nr:HAD family phosphatase [Bdellovibrio sp.]
MFPRIVFSDFDGTLTYGLSLGSFFFDILALIKAKNSELVIVTGRSVSWGHFLLTHTDVSAVISEGGGMLSLREKNNLLCDYPLLPEKEFNRLKKFVALLKEQFPDIPLTNDSIGRMADRAIELAVAKPRLKELSSFMQAHQINYSCSSVHLNFWCSDISKIKGIKYYLANHTQDISIDDCMYFGDSKNDESVFEVMKNTVGVSNIREVVEELTFKPSVLLMGEHNEGPYGVLNYLDYLSRK